MKLTEHALHYALDPLFECRRRTGSGCRRTADSIVQHGGEAFHAVEQAVDSDTDR
jgi:hypothetical protein